MGRLKELDGLRGIAAMLVVLAHFSRGDYFIVLHRFSMANIAVVAFFGLSAFLLCYLAEKNFDRWTFVASRFFRIVPLYMTVVVVTLAVAMLDVYDAKDEQIKNTIGRLWLILGFVLNWSLVNGDTGFLREFGHFWSLCVEMQFYLVLALAFPWLRTLKAWQVIVGSLMIGLSLRSLTLHQQYQYFSSFSYIEIFAFCGLAGVASARGRVMRVNVWLWLALLLVVGFAWQKILWKPEYQFLSGFFYPVIGAVIAISLPSVKSRVLSHPAFVTVGLWSYGIYLWHFPIRMFIEPIAKNQYVFFTLYVGLTFAAAVLTYRLVEKPVNEWRRRHFTREQMEAPLSVLPETSPLR